MRKMILMSLAVALIAVGMCHIPIQETPPPSLTARWVEGAVAYPDGSKCRHCCSIRVETDYGLSLATCSGADADYRIEVASDTATALYFRGDRVWTGRRTTLGGATIDITA